MIIDTLTDKRTGALPIFVPGVNLCNVDKPIPKYVDAVFSTELNSLLPQSQEAIDVQPRPAYHKLNGHTHSPLGFTLLPSVHDRYSARLGQI